MKSKLTGKLILLHINVHFVRAKIYFEVKRIIIRKLILTYESHIQEIEKPQKREIYHAADFGNWNAA